MVTTTLSGARRGKPPFWHWFPTDQGWGAVSDLSLISDLSQKFKHDLWRVKSKLKLSQKQHLTPGATSDSKSFLYWLETFDKMTYWTEMGRTARRRTTRWDYRALNAGVGRMIAPGNREGVGNPVAGFVDSGTSGREDESDAPLMSSIGQFTSNYQNAGAGGGSAHSGVDSEGAGQLSETRTGHISYVTTEDETTDIGELEAELELERQRQSALNKERRALELQREIAKLRAENVAQECEIREQRDQLSSASEASGRGQSRASSRTSRDPARRLQGQGRSSATRQQRSQQNPATTTALDPRSRVEDLMVGLSRRRDASPSPGTSTGPDSWTAEWAHSRWQVMTGDGVRKNRMHVLTVVTIVTVIDT